jgi:hypothetical protein
MNDKRSDFPCPMILTHGRSTRRQELRDKATEAAQAGYKKNADLRSDIARRTTDAIRGGALDPPEGIGRGEIKPGGVKTR